MSLRGVKYTRIVGTRLSKWVAHFCVPFSWLPRLKVMCSQVVLKPQIPNCRYSNTWNSIFRTHPSRPPTWTKVLKRQSSWVGCSLRKDLKTISLMLPAWQRWQSGENTPTVHTYKSFLDIQRSRNHANHLDCTYSHITDQQNSTKRFCSCLVLMGLWAWVGCLGGWWILQIDLKFRAFQKRWNKWEKSINTHRVCVFGPISTIIGGSPDWNIWIKREIFPQRNENQKMKKTPRTLQMMRY